MSTPETESSQATDTIGSLERDDDKGNDHLADLANNQENERDGEDKAPPPPVAARPERTKSIVIDLIRVFSLISDMNYLLISIRSLSRKIVTLPTVPMHWIAIRMQIPTLQHRTLGRKKCQMKKSLRNYG